MTGELRIGLKISQFVVKEILPEGKGGMAIVVKALRKEGEPEVALKISRTAKDPFYFKALKKETETLQKLQHNGVVKILPIFSDIGTVYMERALELKGTPWFFIMEYLEGGSLKEHLKKINHLMFQEAAAIAREVAVTLDYVHSQGIVHNDIKTDNILFRDQLKPGEPFKPVLIDFGIAAKINRIQQDAGAVQWMSPERLQQIKNPVAPEVRVDGTKVDVYAIGVLLYNMLAMKMPFTGKNDSSITSAIMNLTPEHVSSLNTTVPSKLDDLIMSCMAKRPEIRPSLTILAKELDRFSDNRLVTLPQKKGLFRWRK